MKQVGIIFLMLFIATDAYSQGDPNKDFKKFQVGVNFSPDFAYRVLKIEGESNLWSTLIISARNNDEKPKLGITGGLNACYNFNNRIGVETGFQYSNKGYTFRGNGVFISDSFPMLTDLRLSFGFHYLDIPLRANFTFGSGDVKFIGSAGLVANLFIKKTILERETFPDGHTETQRYKSSSSYQYEKVNLSAMISAGISWQLNEQISLRVESIYRQGLTSIIDSPIHEYLYNVGLNCGFYYGF